MQGPAQPPWSGSRAVKASTPLLLLQPQHQPVAACCACSASWRQLSAASQAESRLMLRSINSWIPLRLLLEKMRCTFEHEHSRITGPGL